MLGGLSDGFNELGDDELGLSDGVKVGKEVTIVVGSVVVIG